MFRSTGWFQFGQWSFCLDRPWAKIPLDIVRAPGKYFRIKPRFQYSKNDCPDGCFFVMIGTLRIQYLSKGCA